MRPFRHIPIERKLRLVILAVCSVALCVACGVLFALQYYISRRDFERDLAAVADIIASNSAMALWNEDEEAALDTLSALKAKPNITGAAIVLRNGTRLAQIGDAALPSGVLPVWLTGLHRSGDELIYAQPISRDGEDLGTLLLHPDYRGRVNDLFRLYATILAAVLITSFLVAVLISWRLEQIILDPIRYLAQVSRNITGRHDYSLRAQKLVEDEIGAFTDCFNSMLDQVEQQDTALRHEIAERKRAEQELQALHDQLIDSSRRAGMAEVATGVLHNVGNVLNSVNVSASLLSEKLGSPRMEHLQRATALLRQSPAELSEFLLKDERGRLLPAYLAELGAHLARERVEALAEIEGLMKNIEHIKDIVVMQQSYARVGGLIEPLALSSLIEDALRMNSVSFERHGVKVVRRFARVPAAAVDRHKVLQILLNLLRNAKYAMEGVSTVEKRLVISLRLVDGEAEVRITDRGVGIPAENLTRIFSHGFTTRAEGHGFGLHSAALAAQQMGGRLSAESRGPGLGATFILALPLASSLRPAPQLEPAHA
jgi:signal transduction histidine kinase